MLRHHPVPFPILQSPDDEEESQSTPSTPRSSFLILDPLSDDDLPRRPYSIISLDSGYFSIMGKGSSSFTYNSKPSRSDLCHSSTDNSQTSPKRDGVLKNFLRMTKISLTSPQHEIDPFPFDLPRHAEEDLCAQIHSLPSSRRFSRDPSIDAFEPLDRFVVRRGMKHHPYSRDDAPYMLAYDRTLLDNDKFSEILLRRLNPNRSPSFHDFTRAGPKTILDLGCGSGGWAVEAAEFWPSSQVIGFDLMDPARLRGGAGSSPNNVQWKQGNFVKYKLPFPKNMFDLVRMANLSLCVPHKRWEHVLSEARRVLAQGGRLELIDDHLFFPYTKCPPSADSHGIQPLRPSSSSFDDDNDTDDERLDGDDDGNDDDFFSTKSRFSSLVDTDNFPPQPNYDPVSEWNRNANNSKTLETLFEDMLERKFSINPRPSKVFEAVIDQVFGRYNQCRLHEFNLYLAPTSSQDSDGSSIGSSDSGGSTSLKKAGKDFAKWVTTVDWEHHKEKKQRMRGDSSSDESGPVAPDTISPKAAGRLGIKPTPSHTSGPHPAQSPGLILWPATFIPTSPFELEMHACKHLHSLIGCKAALVEFLQEVAQEQKLPFDQRMADDFIWDYESFRRKRFNWPSECPDSHVEISDRIATTPRSNNFRNSGEVQERPRTGSGNMSPPPEPLYPRDKLDFVRCIKVFSATKVDEEIHFS